jgi:ATP-dependent DNA helicase RecG
MTKEELIQKLTSLEWEDFEVKAAHSELPKSIWETVSAFSNTSGGWLVLGVNQRGTDFRSRQCRKTGTGLFKHFTKYEV